MNNLDNYVKDEPDMTPKVNPKATTLGLDENLEAAGAYVFGFVSGIVVYVLEKDNKFVRFHAMQSIIAFIALFIINTLVEVLPYYLWFLSTIVGLIGFILWIVLMLKAYQGEKFKLPVVGQIAEGQVK